MRRFWFALPAAAAALTLGTSSLALADDSSTDLDDQQEQTIQARLERAPDLKNNRIEVDVDDGIVVLEGTVDSQREKIHAQQIAHMDGILGVNNRLKVRSAGK